MANSRELTVVAEQLLAPVPGGTGRYTAELLRALAETAPAGWTVSSVVAFRRDVSAARIEGVRGPRRLPLSRRALAVAWRTGAGPWPGGHAVHAPTPLAPPWRPPGHSLSVTAHDVVPWTHPETLTAHGAAWHRTMVGRAARRADSLVVPTSAVADDLATRVPEASGATVVGHGVGARLRAGTTEPPELPRRFVLALGTIEPRKGIDVLIEAMTRLSGVDLVLVGPEGWGGCDPRALVSARGLRPDRLWLPGRLSDGQLAATFRRAAVLAVPSLAEGFGLPLLEAMASGVPVVHSDAAALVEVAGGAGWTVPRGDAGELAAGLDRVLGCRTLADRMVATGRARAEEFSWHDAARRIWRLHTSW